MTKGKRNILAIFTFVLLQICVQPLQAQIEVIPPDDEIEEFYFDSVSKQIPAVVEERKIPDSLIKQLQRDEAFWYANTEMQKKEVADNNRNLSLAWMKEDWVRSLLWFMMIGLFVGILIWFLSTLNVHLFRRTSSPITTAADETIQEDIFSISYQTEINKAISANNYRQAVRLYYLQALALLSKKALIDYKQDRTNSEYVNQLRKTSYYKDFFGLTKTFEYTWYGKFEITQPVFKIVQKDFETFYNQLSS